MNPNPNAVSCASCGCLGNCDCGHEPYDKERCCTLDAAEICPCCRVKQRHCETKPKADERQPE